MQPFMSEELQNKQKLEEQRYKIKLQIEYTENAIDYKKHELAVLENRYKQLVEDVKVDYILMLIVFVILLAIGYNALYIIYRFVTAAFMEIVLFIFIVGVIGQIVRKVIKDLPSYIRCRKEEKGIACNHDNYVFKINQKKREIEKLTSELDRMKQIVK